MQDFDYTLTWYHGSQQKLTTLRVGSSITQNRNMAKAFSHRPSLLTQSEGGTVKHDGVTSGYLYTVAGEISPDDVYPHPHPVNVIPILPDYIALAVLSKYGNEVIFAIAAFGYFPRIWLNCCCICSNV